MLFDDRSGSAVDKGSVFQLALDFSQLAFDLCNFLIQPSFLPCFVRRGNGQENLAERCDRDRIASLRLVLPIQCYFFGI